MSSIPAERSNVRLGKRSALEVRYRVMRLDLMLSIVDDEIYDIVFLLTIDPDVYPGKGPRTIRWYRHRSNRMPCPCPSLHFIC